MDRPDAEPPTLAARLRRAKVDDRVAALLTAALADELGAGILRDYDAAAARRLTDLVQAAARRAGTSAVSTLVFEILELLDEAPDLRDQVTRLHPEMGQD